MARDLHRSHRSIGLALLVAAMPVPLFAIHVHFEKAIDVPQEFVSAEWGYGVCPTRDGGYALAGFTTTSFLPLLGDVLLVKTDPGGEVAWTRRYGGDAGDEGKAVVECADGGFAIAGATQSEGAGSADLYLVRTDAQGALQWTRTYGSPRLDTGEDVCEMPDGGFTIVGMTMDAEGQSDLFVVRTHANGDVKWSRTYGGASEDGAASVRRAGDGLLVAGYSASFGNGFYDAYVLRLDADGNELWSRTYGGPDEDWASTVVPTADGGVFVAGTRDRPFLVSFGGVAWALRLDSGGNVVWERTFGTRGTSDANGLAGVQAADGAFVLAGSQVEAGGDLRMLAVRWTGDGDFAWSRTFGAPGQTTHGADVQEAAPGRWVLAGYTTRLETWYDLALVKIGDDEATDTASDPAPPGRFHPNPFAVEARFDFGSRSSHGPVEMRVFDAAGRCIVHRRARSDHLVLRRDDLGRGVYFYTISAGDRSHRGRVTVR